MKVVHWTQFNHSGMNRVAESMVEAEKRLGLDSIILNTFLEQNWDHALDADVHVSHTWMPYHYNGKPLERQLSKPFRLVWVGHGTPEHIVQSTAQEAMEGRHGMGDGLMLWLYWLQNAHARVTFWPRHKWIYDTMVDRGSIVDLVPLGVDREFWTAGSSKQKWAGSPSVWSGENPHFIKWPLDLVLAWPHVWPELNNASLHLQYVAQNLHRVFAPLMARNGAAYGMHWDANIWAHDELRNVFKSVDYFVGLVRYGDFNRLSLEAATAGAKTISYPGNPYADFWVTEGDQRVLARDLVDILSGNRAPRADKEAVPDFMDTARGMQAIYERIVP